MFRSAAQRNGHSFRFNKVTFDSLRCRSIEQNSWKLEVLYWPEASQEVLKDRDAAGARKWFTTTMCHPLFSANEVLFGEDEESVASVKWCQVRRSVAPYCRGAEVSLTT